MARGTQVLGAPNNPTGYTYIKKALRQFGEPFFVSIESGLLYGDIFVYILATNECEEE